MLKVWPPVGFRPVSLSSCRGVHVVQNFSAYQSPELPFLFFCSVRKIKRNCKGDLALCQVSSNSVHDCWGEVENVTANQKPSFFPERHEKHIIGRKRFVKFRCATSEKSKMWKVNDRRTDRHSDGRRTKPDHSLHVSVEVAQTVCNQSTCCWFDDTVCRSSGGRVVKLLACGARGPRFDSRPPHLNFQRLVISCFQVEIWLKDR